MCLLKSSRQSTMVSPFLFLFLWKFLLMQKRRRNILWLIMIKNIKNWTLDNAIRLRTRPHVSGYFWIRNSVFLFGFKIFHVHTYPYSNRICPSKRIRYVSGFSLVPRTSLEILATEHASWSTWNGSCST